MCYFGDEFREAAQAVSRAVVADTLACKATEAFLFSSDVLIEYVCPEFDQRQQEAVEKLKNLPAFGPVVKPGYWDIELIHRSFPKGLPLSWQLTALYGFLVTSYDSGNHPAFVRLVFPRAPEIIEGEPLTEYRYVPDPMDAYRIRMAFSDFLFRWYWHDLHRLRRIPDAVLAAFPENWPFSQPFKQYLRAMRNSLTTPAEEAVATIA
jgi:hypothetical protein